MSGVCIIMESLVQAKDSEVPCAACGEPVEFNHSIHRDGFCEGPEVWICDGCGSDELPTCEQIYAAIAQRRDEGFEPVEHDGRPAPNGGAS